MTSKAHSDSEDIVVCYGCAYFTIPNICCCPQKEISGIITKESKHECYLRGYRLNRYKFCVYGKLPKHKPCI